MLFRVKTFARNETTVWMLVHVHHLRHTPAADESVDLMSKKLTILEQMTSHLSLPNQRSSDQSASSQYFGWWKTCRIRQITTNVRVLIRRMWTNTYHQYIELFVGLVYVLKSVLQKSIYIVLEQAEKAINWPIIASSADNSLKEHVSALLSIGARQRCRFEEAHFCQCDVLKRWYIFAVEFQYDVITVLCGLMHWEVKSTQ